MTLGIIRMTFLWLDQKPFDIIAGSARNGLTAFGESRTSTKGWGGGKKDRLGGWCCVKVYLYLQLLLHKYLIRGHNLSYCAHRNLDPL